MKLNSLSEEEKRVILEKGTEDPGTGEFENNDLEGVYTCRQCNAFLYRSEDKFDAHCGWPAFDDEISGAIRRNVDADGRRTEITCNRCDGHLGHVFEGEKLTDKNIRHCVNSISMKFIESNDPALAPEKRMQKVYLGGGCFWCIEAVFKMIKGVESVESGYAGGDTENPTYKEICNGDTGHTEVVKIVFDQTEVSLEKILDVFFDSHDPTTLNRQGNDVGTQYRSAIFTESDEMLELVKNYLDRNSEKIEKKYTEGSGKIVTEVRKLENGAKDFYKAELNHQDYYAQNSVAPYCRVVITPKIEKIEKKYKDDLK
jgi:peptide methionine sulfoxide reductase msrA/msrB